MKTTEIERLTPGRIYRVQIRHSEMDLKTRKVTHKASRRVPRKFHRMEMRFGSIPCAVFSSAMARNGSRRRNEISVPHYDLLLAEPMAEAIPA